MAVTLDTLMAVIPPGEYLRNQWFGGDGSCCPMGYLVMDAIGHASHRPDDDTKLRRIIVDRLDVDEFWVEGFLVGWDSGGSYVPSVSEPEEYTAGFAIGKALAERDDYTQRTLRL